MKRMLSVFVLCNAGPYFVRTTRGDQRNGCQFQSADREFHPRAVPAATSSGKISVTNAGGTATSAKAFTVQ
jgi:hypothetical protein